MKRGILHDYGRCQCFSMQNSSLCTVAIRWWTK